MQIMCPVMIPMGIRDDKQSTFDVLSVSTLVDLQIIPIDEVLFCICCERNRTGPGFDFEMVYTSVILFM
jgi:hypothetical protein